jgi:Ca2+-binding EF-hand superfamily protein
LSPAQLERLGADGFPIPEQFKDALGRFDQDKDGKLSRAEIDDMPEGLRERVNQAIERRLRETDRSP